MIDYYSSPRISGEFLDCSMPMTFDQYSNCGYNCLRGDTEILLSDGKVKRMENLKIGDRLWSYDLGTMEIKTSVVEKVSKRYAKNIIAIVHNSNKKVCLTEEHLVYTKKGWIKAGELTKGDEVLRIWKGNVIDNSFWKTDEGRRVGSKNMKEKWEEGKIPSRKRTKEEKECFLKMLKKNNPSKTESGRKRLSDLMIKRFNEGTQPVFKYKYGMGNYSNGQTKLYEMLDKLNISYVKEYCFRADGGCPNKSRVYVDAFIPDYKMAVEYDGFPYHAFKETIEKDKLRDIWLKEKGITVLRVRGNEIQDDSYVENLIRTNHRKWIKIKKIKKYDMPNLKKFREGFVYDLELSGEHNFVASGVLVHNCLYCFSTFQRGIGGAAHDYWLKKVKYVNVEKFKKLFLEAGNKTFGDIIRQKMIMQWGGLSDPFCPLEEKFGVGYEILKFLNEIEYPVRFSSKTDLFLRNEKYLKLITEKPHLWYYMSSIITADEAKAAIVEGGAPSPQRRFENLKLLADRGIYTALRLRPFIIGLSDKTMDELFEKAAWAGCKSVSTEFFCLEVRMTPSLRQKYDDLSKVLGFDIVKFYKTCTSSSGYLRLNYSIKAKYIDRMMRLAEKYKIRFFCSDAQHKEKSYGASCCGLPEDHPYLSNFNRCQFTNALMIAKSREDHIVKFSDIAKDDKFMSKVKWDAADGLNTGNSMKRGKYHNLTLLEYMRSIWNNPKSSLSPYRYFGGILKPVGLDENKDIVYKLDAGLMCRGVNSQSCINCGLRNAGLQ